MTRFITYAAVIISSVTLLACSSGDGSHAQNAQDSQGVEATLKTHSPREATIHQGLMAERIIVRAPLPGRTTAMGTMVVMNHTSNGDRLIGVKSPISETIEIHTMLNEDGVMKMRRLENGIAIAPGAAAELKGGSDHLMMFNTVIPDGAESVPLTLIFEKAGEVKVTALVDDGTLSRSDDTMDHSGH